MTKLTPENGGIAGKRPAAYAEGLAALREDTRALWLECLDDPPNDGYGHEPTVEALETGAHAYGADPRAGSAAHSRASLIRSAKAMPLAFLMNADEGIRGAPCADRYTSQKDRRSSAAMQLHLKPSTPGGALHQGVTIAREFAVTLASLGLVGAENQPEPSVLLDQLLPESGGSKVAPPHRPVGEECDDEAVAVLHRPAPR